MIPLALAAPAIIQGVAGLGQSLYGMFQASQNKRPSLDPLQQNIRDQYTNIGEAQERASLAQQRSQRGFSPEQLNVAQGNIQRGFDTAGANLRSSGSGRGAILAGQASNALGAGLAYGDLSAQDAMRQMQNQQYSDVMGAQVGQQRAALAPLRNTLYGAENETYQQQAASANAMTGAGIQNIVGAGLAFGQGAQAQKGLDLKTKELSMYQPGYNLNTTTVNSNTPTAQPPITGNGSTGNIFGGGGGGGGGSSASLYGQSQVPKRYTRYKEGGKISEDVSYTNMLDQVADLTKGYAQPMPSYLQPAQPPITPPIRQYQEGGGVTEDEKPAPKKPPIPIGRVVRDFRGQEVAAYDPETGKLLYAQPRVISELLSSGLGDEATLSNAPLAYPPMMPLQAQQPLPTAPALNYPQDMEIVLGREQRSKYPFVEVRRGGVPAFANRMIPEAGVVPTDPTVQSAWSEFETFNRSLPTEQTIIDAQGREIVKGNVDAWDAREQEWQGKLQVPYQDYKKLYNLGMPNTEQLGTLDIGSLDLSVPANRAYVDSMLGSIYGTGSQEYVAERAKLQDYEAAVAQAKMSQQARTAQIDAALGEWGKTQSRQMQDRINHNAISMQDKEALYNQIYQDSVAYNNAIEAQRKIAAERAQPTAPTQNGMRDGGMVTTDKPKKEVSLLDEFITAFVKRK